MDCAGLMPIFQGFNLCQFQSDVSLSDAEWNASGVILQISLESNEVNTTRQCPRLKTADRLKLLTAFGNPVFLTR